MKDDVFLHLWDVGKRCWTERAISVQVRGRPNSCGHELVGNVLWCSLGVFCLYMIDVLRLRLKLLFVYLAMPYPAVLAFMVDPILPRPI